jgi:PAS domain S-box-containing protein
MTGGARRRPVPFAPSPGLFAAFGLLSRRAAPVPTALDESTQLLLDMPLGVLLLLDDGQRIRYTNHAIERFLGYTPKEVVGRPIGQLFAASARDALSRLIDQHLPGDPTAAGEFKGVRKDGVSVPLQVVVQSAVVSGMSGSKITGVYLRDFSERERLVDALASRGAALARSNRELEQFAYIASHDLQEPLRMVGSYTQLLEQRYSNLLDDDAREFLRYAREGASRMRELIDALLSYSRIDTRAQPFRRVSMDQVLELALTNLRESIGAAHGVVVRSALPEVEGDPVQLGQVLQNLIGNAIKFHGPNPPHVWVHAERKGAEWRFAVRDDGIGIAPEYQDRIFILFQRLHSREEYPGTGIGLSVCKKVVERHGGKLWVESTGKPGDGTTFFFTLPVERASAKPSETVDASPVDRRVKVEAMSLIEERLKELV